MEQQVCPLFCTTGEEARSLLWTLPGTRGRHNHVCFAPRHGLSRQTCELHDAVSRPSNNLNFQRRFRRCSAYLWLDTEIVLIWCVCVCTAPINYAFYAEDLKLRLRCYPKAIFRVHPNYVVRGVLTFYLLVLFVCETWFLTYKEDGKVANVREKDAEESICTKSEEVLRGRGRYSEEHKFVARLWTLKLFPFFPRALLFPSTWSDQSTCRLNATPIRRTRRRSLMTY
jgi:hypothetical protein